MGLSNPGEHCYSCDVGLLHTSYRIELSGESIRKKKKV
jgi:hypothetical protein